MYDAESPAPEIADPSRNHTYEYVNPVPLNVPVVADNIEPTAAVPDTTGPGEPATGAAGTSNALLVALADPPPFIAVTRTDTACPASAETTVYDAESPAPEIAEPSRNHTYEYVKPVPLNVPVVADNIEPTAAVPDTTGPGEPATGAAGTSNALLVALADPPPFIAVTRTDTACPASAATSMYDDESPAPEIADPSRNHTYEYVNPVPLNVPVVADNIEPTAAVPDTTGPGEPGFGGTGGGDDVPRAAVGGQHVDLDATPGRLERLLTHGSGTALPAGPVQFAAGTPLRSTVERTRSVSRTGSPTRRSGSSA